MLARTFLPRHLLRHLYGTEPFVRFCERQGIVFSQTPGKAMGKGAETRWRQAFGRLPESERALAERELARVNELADPDSIALLCEAARGRRLPPDSVPGDAARSLWFFLHQPVLFHEVLLRQDTTETGAWRVAQGPLGHSVTDTVGRHAALADGLRDLFRSRDQTGQYGVVDAFPLRKTACFVAHLSDRLQLLDVFTGRGRRTTRATRTAVPVTFVYDPATGRILLKTRLRSHDRIVELVQCFGQAVLDVDLSADCLRPAYHLDRLKRGFDPPADADDMEAVRVKSLHLAYPERQGRRWVKLETRAGDLGNAIRDLLREHAGSRDTLEELTVRYAELEITLRIEGARKPFVVRLWPDRTSLGRTALGDRFHACLRRWGLTHAE